jgi:hypothetical protein
MTSSLVPSPTRWLFPPLCIWHAGNEVVPLYRALHSGQILLIPRNSSVLEDVLHSVRKRKHKQSISGRGNSILDNTLSKIKTIWFLA